MLVLYAVVSVSALRAMPDHPQLDAFGGTICTSDTDDQGGGHDEASDCCMLACSMGSQLLPTASDTGWTRHAPGASDTLQPPPQTVRIHSNEYHPGNPRAPPPVIS
ncbi:MAG TPA: hypothetical protein VL202_18450 [Pararhizobium sp.]|nr:hypothetical protein [Pararhizobium sp.]HTO33136.1 hypothetical protein [Pararhizobium sp.]